MDIDKVLNRALMGNYIALPIPLWCPLWGEYVVIVLLLMADEFAEARPPHHAPSAMLMLRARPMRTKNNKKYAKYKFRTNFIFCFYHVFIKIGLMGWIRIDFALLNTFANCDFYIFF